MDNKIDIKTIKDLVSQLHSHLKIPPDAENVAGLASEANVQREMGATEDVMHQAMYPEEEEDESGNDYTDRLPKKQKRKGMF